MSDARRLRAADSRAAAARQPPSMPAHDGSCGRLDRWLHVLAERGGSDLLLVAGAPPSIRVDGRVQPLAEGPLDGVDIEEAVLPALPPHARRSYRDAQHRRRLVPHRRRRPVPHQPAPRARPRRGGDPRCCRPVCPGFARSACRRASSADARCRAAWCSSAAPTGSGKTTTLAALVDEINRRDARHIVTIEDPIEYEHAHHAEHHRAGRDRRRRAGLSDGAARRAAPGARRHRRRRDARSRDDAHRAGRRRDGAPGAVHAAHDRRGVDDRRASPIRFRPSGRTRSGRSWRWRWRRW